MNGSESSAMRGDEYIGRNQSRRAGCGRPASSAQPRPNQHELVRSVVLHGAAVFVAGEDAAEVGESAALEDEPVRLAAMAGDPALEVGVVEVHVHDHAVARVQVLALPV